MKDDDGALEDTVTVPASIAPGQAGRHPLWDSGEHVVPPGKRSLADLAATAQTAQIEILKPLTAAAAASREAARSPVATAQTVPVEVIKPLTAPAAASREAAKPAQRPAAASREAAKSAQRPVSAPREAVKPAAVPAPAPREARGSTGRPWLARHGASVAVAGIAVVALAGVVGVERSMRVQHLAEDQRALAVARSTEAEALLGFLLGDLHDKLTPLGKLDLLDAAASKAVAYYDRTGNLLRDAGDKPGALAAYRAALAIATSFAAGAPTNPAWTQQVTRLDATIATCCAR